MSTTNNIIIDSIYTLLDSTTHLYAPVTKSGLELQKAIIKKFFNASSVQIDYEKKEINLGLEMLSKGCEIAITYEDLNTFLRSCIRTTNRDLTFYKNILHYYSTRDAVA